MELVPSPLPLLGPHGGSEREGQVSEGRKAGQRLDRGWTLGPPGQLFPPALAPPSIAHSTQKESYSSRLQSVDRHFLPQACTPNHSDVTTTCDLTASAPQWKITVGPRGVSPELQSPSPKVSSSAKGDKCPKPGLWGRPAGRRMGEGCAPSIGDKGPFGGNLSPLPAQGLRHQGVCLLNFKGC